jgi:hypothetical protein
MSGYEMATWVWVCDQLGTHLDSLTKTLTTIQLYSGCFTMVFDKSLLRNKSSVFDKSQSILVLCILEAKHKAHSQVLKFKDMVHRAHLQDQTTSKNLKVMVEPQVFF